MKKLFKTFMAVALVSSLGVLSSCDKTCDEGFEGSKCDTEVRAKYFGTYKVSGTAANAGGSTNITDLIVAVGTSSSEVTKFTISYTLFGDNYSLIGKLNSNGTTFEVANQTVTISGSPLTYSGSGTFSTSSMTLQLTEIDGSVTTTVNLTGPKQ
jgi:hypothetical protein